jgi:galactokinase
LIGRVLSLAVDMGKQVRCQISHEVEKEILDEVLQVRPDFIKHQLAHAVRGPNGWANNWTAHLDERKKMMQQWSAYLEGLKAGAKVLSFAKRRDMHY